MSRATLLIYAKPPRIGLSKTRLAAGLGRAEAQRIARFTMGKTVRVALDERWRTVLYTAPDSALNDTLGGIWPPALIRKSQGHGDLTDRLNKGLNEAPRGPVLFIGADAPDLSKPLIWRAIRALKKHDAVFGPARDGGFWLFGLNKTARTASPFRDIRWSGPYAMADVKRNLGAASVAPDLSVLIDIDEASDWRAWRDFHK